MEDKYRKALDRLCCDDIDCRKCCLEGVMYCLENPTKEKAREILQKLVDKETPMKMTKYIPNESRHWYRCGNCNTTLANRISISHVINTDDINYCPKCGQKINKELE